MLVNSFAMTGDMESAFSGGDSAFGEVFRVECNAQHPAVLVICEHASNRIPEAMGNLGLTPEIAQSHIGWDPGALGVATHLAQAMPSVLVHGTVSRLVYDCNRPPDAETAIPARSEVYDIPGNTSLSNVARKARIDQVYRPFERAVRDQIANHKASLTIIVTVHSFTPVFNGLAREVELGVLHGQDDRLALAMMRLDDAVKGFDLRLNEPYSAQDGVAHTLDLHGAGNGLLNVMIEIRNDLIATSAAQAEMAERLGQWIAAAMGDLSQGESAA